MNPMITLTTVKLKQLLLGIIFLQSIFIIPASYAFNSLPRGKYKCLQFAASTVQAGSFGAFTLDGKGKYTNTGYQTSGRYRYDSQSAKVSFTGGKFDGYTATVEENTTTGKAKLVFRAKDPDGGDRVFKQWCQS
jgi:VCBS repeat-containing protein